MDAAPAAASPAISLLMPFMSRLGNSSASLRGSVSSSASMRWIASGSPLTAAAMHARINRPRPAGRSAGNSVRAASASSEVGIRRSPDGHRQHAAHPRRGAAHHRVAQFGLGTIEQRFGMAEAPGHRRRDGGRHQVLGAALGIGIQLGGALQRAGGGGVPAAARGVIRSEDQRLGRVVVGRGGGGGAVPRAPVDVGAVLEHGGERLVRRAALGEARGAVDRRAHERMAEAQPRALAVSRPARSATSSASGPKPRRSEARSSVPTSPLSSAAASTSRRRASSPSGSTRTMKARSIRSLSGRSRRSGARPVRSSSVSATGSSSSASGLPPVAPTRSSRTTAGSVPSSSAAASALLSPASLSSGSPWASNCRASPSRAPMSTAIGSACSRRATNTSASADAPSSQCASSTTHSSGCASAAAVSRPKTATETRKRSFHALVRQPEGASQRGALHVGQLAGAVEERPQQLMQPGERQLGLGLHAGAGEHPHAVRLLQAYCSSAVLPIPASPRRTSVPLRDCPAAWSRRLTAAHSLSRPSSTVRLYDGLGGGTSDVLDSTRVPQSPPSQHDC